MPSQIPESNLDSPNNKGIENVNVNPTITGKDEIGKGGGNGG